MFKNKTITNAVGIHVLNFKFQYVWVLEFRIMNIHCIALSQPPLSHLALALHHKGDTVTGSDTTVKEPAKSKLATAGLLPKALGWHPHKIHQQLHAVIVGAHIQPHNPELQRAQHLELPLYTYPEFIYQHAQHKTRVVMAGSRGKTLATATLLHVLCYHNIAVDYAVSTPPAGEEHCIHLTTANDFMVIEGEEYHAAAWNKRPQFPHYRPNIALLSNIAQQPQHTFPTPEAYREPFQNLVENIVKGGSITYNTEDPEVKKLVENSKNPIRKLPYRTPKHRIADERVWLNTPEGEMPLEAVATHNLSTLAGTQWIAQQMGVDETDFYQALASFTPTPR